MFKLLILQKLYNISDEELEYQVNSKEEKEQLDQGKIPQNRQEKPHRLSQRDTDARWTKKNNVSHFGYKDHISVDVEHGFVRKYGVTDAAVHDSQALPDILDEDNEGDEVWADCAYYSALIEWLLALLNWCSRIHQRGYRNRPLTEQQKENNREKSKTRAKVEHVFGAWVNEMGGKLIRSIGIERAEANLGLRNLAYNLKRYVYLETRVAKAA